MQSAECTNCLIPVMNCELFYGAASFTFVPAFYHQTRHFMQHTTALVTGATSGIGQATARKMAASGLRLILCGRRTGRLAELQQELSAQTEVTTLAFDVRDQQQVLDAIGSL